MFVREILKGKDDALRTVAPGEALEYCAAHMKLENVGALVVCGDDRRLQGMISERDIVRAIVDNGPRALQMKAEDFMDAHPETCSREDTIASVARKMTQARRRHVPVCENGKVVAVVSVGDVVKHRFEEMELESATLRDLAGMHQVAR